MPMPRRDIKQILRADDRGGRSSYHTAGIRRGTVTAPSTGTRIASQPLHAIVRSSADPETSAAPSSQGPHDATRATARWLIRLAALP